ncbi:MAG: hypothetical protein PHC60_03520 [Heliobacteriaceae bacterium]|nr:hypothetical protein [Heliobacteriaceae bacterium]
MVGWLLAGVVLPTAVSAFLLGSLASDFVPGKIAAPAAVAVVGAAMICLVGGIAGLAGFCRQLKAPAGSDNKTAGAEKPACLGPAACWGKVAVRLVSDLQNSLGIIWGAVRLLEEETGYRSDVLGYTQIIAGQVRRQNERLQALPAEVMAESALGTDQ